MAGLARTDLTILQKVELATAALSAEGQYGAIAELGRNALLSRPTIYRTLGEAKAALARHFEELESSFAKVPVLVDEAQLRRAIVALRCVAPNSIRAIEALVPLIYPNVRLSYGKIQQICAEAESCAAEFNAEADLSGITAGALDEMFSQGKPVLAGIDLDTGYLFALALRDSRATKDWVEVLAAGKEQGLALETVVKDAAPGIAAGVRDVFPNAEQRDDCFHAHYEMGKLYWLLERRAYGAIAQEEQLEQAIEAVRRTGRGDRRKLAVQLRVARQRCRRAIERFDRYEEAVREVQEAMEYIDLYTAELSDPQAMTEQIIAAGEKMMKLDDPRCPKVARYIINRAPGLVLYLGELVQKLEALFPRHGETEVRLAAQIWRLFRDLRHHRWPWQRDDDERLLLQSVHKLRELTGGDWSFAVYSSAEPFCIARVPVTARK